MRSNPLTNKRHGSCSRRTFLGCAGCALAAGALSSSFAGDASPPNSTAAQPNRAPPAGRSPLIWANLLHLSYNMWRDRPVEQNDPVTKAATYQPYLRFDDKLWEELTKRMADVGMNMVVIDVGDGVRYQSHPEIAVRGAWSVERLCNELARLRKLGLEPIPKEFFDLPRHVAWRVFAPSLDAALLQGLRRPDRRSDPSLRQAAILSLGYDEETAEHQREYAYAVVRQHELWWHDFEFFVKQVERRGARPWIWSDYAWKHGEEFLKRMPKSVLQSNWYYGKEFRIPTAVCSGMTSWISTATIRCRPDQTRPTPKTSA